MYSCIYICVCTCVLYTIFVFKSVKICLLLTGIIYSIIIFVVVYNFSFITFFFDLIVVDIKITHILKSLVILQNQTPIKEKLVSSGVFLI